MQRVKDLTGQRFGRWTVLELAERRRSGKTMTLYWKCRCDCGTVKIIRGGNLKTGNTKSCGCINAERNFTNYIVHGQKGTRLYRIWNGIKNRCTNANDESYKRYGARGISICDEWANDFMAFHDWAIENGYSDNLSIDRIDNNGNYEPSNCRWADNKTQCRNRSSNHLVTYSGKTQTIAEWESELGFKKDILTTRLSHGWSVEKAIETPYTGYKFKCGKDFNKKVRETIVELDGEEHKIAEWCLLKGLKENTIIKRMRRGMDAYEAITKPLGNVGRWNKTA